MQVSLVFVFVDVVDVVDVVDDGVIVFHQTPAWKPSSRPRFRQA